MPVTGRISLFLNLTACLVLLSGCGENGYLLQSVKGHLQLMSRAQPIDEILAGNDEPPSVRNQLETVVRLREFAVDTLHLPDNGSYREYADLKRPYVVWNLTAAPEFSLEPSQWCFPVVGCVTYRGYFDQESAHNMAEKLAAKGFDVDVYGVEAYSTLNWFDDPVLNTFLMNDEIHLAALLFHEMAHQVVYVPDATAFNESFAKTVEREGLRRWFLGQKSHSLWQECQQRERQSADFQAFLGTLRRELQKVYLSSLPEEEKRLAKQRVIAHGHERYARLKEEWGGFAGYDSWMAKGINNARLASLDVYYELVPAFEKLLHNHDYDLTAFYAEVKRIGALPAAIRRSELEALAPGRKASLR
jgi:predicted aminopeptidase